MGLTSRLVASGSGWRVTDVVCTAGPHDPSFEERHDVACVAAVLAGSFQYRSPRGAATLAPGALLLGNEGERFECGHEHGAGDRCLAFHLEPEHLEATAAAIPGARQAAFQAPRLPPLERLMPLVSAAEVARDERDGEALEELALRIGAAAIALTSGATQSASAPSTRDDRRVSEAVRTIERNAREPLSLSALAREAAMSPYHFLRTFRALIGMTPHQYVLRTRLHRAAVRLRRSNDPVSTIAFDEGFNDLSTFNRRFRRVMGQSPQAYRAVRG
jgi:AraC family transcriptional regulator